MQNPPLTSAHQRYLPKPAVSVVIPVFNAEGCVPELLHRLNAVLDADDQIVLVDDFSNDDSWQKIEQSAAADHRICGVRLDRNHGQYRAIAAGLSQARGALIVVMDCDLQDSPEAISTLLNAQSKSGNLIINVRRVRRRDGLFRRVTSRIVTASMRLMGLRRMSDGSATFSLICSSVAQKYLALAKWDTVYPVLLHELGGGNLYVDIVHQPRFSGRSAYSFWDRLKIALHATRHVLLLRLTLADVSSVTAKSVFTVAEILNAPDS
ncbi:MAG: glycosyltransferase involved in cell wall biosynthesis [Akkermansiaceae bacterium]|jgi:glycosyltransferase involved in cell wall biosynthesis